MLPSTLNGVSFVDRSRRALEDEIDFLYSSRTFCSLGGRKIDIDIFIIVPTL